MKTLILAALLLLQAPAKPSIIGNPESHVYHVRCTHVLTCKKCTVAFQTEADATRQGYHICPFAKKAAVKP